MRISLATALWRTRAYLIPQVKHFVVYAALIGVGMLLELATFLFGFDLLFNKVFLGDPLSAEQASLLGLDPAIYVQVEALGEEARYTLRNVFLTFMVATIVFGFVLGAILPYYLTWILQRVNQHLRLVMMERAMHLSLRYHNDSEVGDAIYRVYQDSAMVTNVVQRGLIEPVTALGNLALAVATLSFFAPYLGLLFLLAAVASVVAVSLFTPRLRRQSQSAREANSALTGHIQESVARVRLLKANRAEFRAADRFDERSEVALDHAFDLRTSVALLNMIVAFCTAIVIFGADYLMAGWVWRDTETWGFGVIALVGFATWNLGAFQAARERSIAINRGAMQLSNIWAVLQDMGVGLHRAFFLLDLEPEVKDKPGALPMPDIGRGVSFNDVQFSYEPDQAVLNGITFEAAPGTMTAIVGSTGAGKSTLLNLLLRLYEKEGGDIQVGGVSIDDVRVSELRRAVSVVLQENALFPTSIADNIRYAAPDADDEALHEAARIACADEFIEALDAGYATELGERGAKLSTGQRQRISIARAVLKDAPILILDEPTASLDVVTERDVLRRLNEWGQDKVMFLVTHRIATIREVDQILFLEDGKIVDQGTHETLMGNPAGRYHRFVTSELELVS
ncbi:MAG: ABC transporter ATP-binding protein [Pseudomonadota bacterium]